MLDSIKNLNNKKAINFNLDSIESELKLSSLNKTFILDLDGSICKHNTNLKTANLLNGVAEFFDNFSKEDFVLIVSARKECDRADIIEFLKRNNLRFNALILGVPVGERILVNDKKPSGLKTAYAINLERDLGIDLKIKIDTNL